MAAATSYHPCLAQTAIQRQPPEVGAVCEKDARPDLCGGREVTCVPTATAITRVYACDQAQSGRGLMVRTPDCAHSRASALCASSGLRVRPASRYLSLADNCL